MPIQALVGLEWSVTNTPSTGLTDITFPMTVVKADHISGYYFAQQFGFFGLGGFSDIGYIGIQPRPNSNGKPTLHGTFSSFIKGTSTNDQNCSPGADGGVGVSCSFEWNGPYENTYNLEVKRTNERTWVGTAINTATNDRMHLGSWTLPEGSKGIRGNQVGFIEWYPWNGGEPPNHCAKLPFSEIIFGDPETTTSGSVGKVSLAYEYGDCVGQVSFMTERKENGTKTHLGFRGQTGN
jgi:hypothetical protein